MKRHTWVKWRYITTRHNRSYINVPTQYTIFNSTRETRERCEEAYITTRGHKKDILLSYLYARDNRECRKWNGRVFHVSFAFVSCVFYIVLFAWIIMCSRLCVWQEMRVAWHCSIRNRLRLLWYHTLQGLTQHTNFAVTEIVWEFL